MAFVSSPPSLINQILFSWIDVFINNKPQKGLLYFILPIIKIKIVRRSCPYKPLRGSATHLIEVLCLTVGFELCHIYFNEPDKSFGAEWPTNKWRQNEIYGSKPKDPAQKLDSRWRKLVPESRKNLHNNLNKCQNIRERSAMYQIKQIFLPSFDTYKYKNLKKFQINSVQFYDKNSCGILWSGSEI